jgi:hypothetical protein
VLDGVNASIALTAAWELEFVSLPDALELVLLLIDDPPRLRRAALRWHARYWGDLPDVGFEAAHACSRVSPSPAAGGRSLRLQRWPSSSTGADSNGR